MRKITRVEDLQDDLRFTEDPFRIAVITEEIEAHHSDFRFAYREHRLIHR